MIWAMVAGPNFAIFSPFNPVTCRDLNPPPSSSARHSGILPPLAERRVPAVYVTKHIARASRSTSPAQEPRLGVCVYVFVLSAAVCLQVPAQVVMSLSGCTSMRMSACKLTAIPLAFSSRPNQTALVREWTPSATIFELPSRSG
jgi:hypothetical protein